MKSRLNLIESNTIIVGENLKRTLSGEYAKYIISDNLQDILKKISLFKCVTSMMHYFFYNSALFIVGYITWLLFKVTNICI